jgi:hypothetical protein
VQVYNPVVATAYTERLLNKPQAPATVRFFLISGPTVPAIFLLSTAFSFGVGAATFISVMPSTIPWSLCA